VIFPRVFDSFGWIIPVIIVSNIPARLLIKPRQPGASWLHLTIAGLGVLYFARFLAFRPPALFQRQLINVGGPLPVRRPGFCG
jgi:hypothetical protein